MATTYVRRFNLKDSLSDDEVAAYWKMVMDELIPAVMKVKGVTAVRVWSAAGALRADLRVGIEMENAGVYETMIADPALPKLLGQFYGSIDMKTSTQTFLREVTPALISALTGGR